MSTIPKSFALVEYPTTGDLSPKRLATGDADTIRLAYAEHAATAEGSLRIYEIDSLTGNLLTGEDPF